MLASLNSLSLRSREEIRHNPERSLNRSQCDSVVKVLNGGAFPALRDLHLYAEGLDLQEACAKRGINYHLPDGFWDEVREAKTGGQGEFNADGKKSGGGGAGAFAMAGGAFLGGGSNMMF